MDKIRNGDTGAEEVRLIPAPPEPPEGTVFDWIPIKTTASTTIRQQSFL